MNEIAVWFFAVTSLCAPAVGPIASSRLGPMTELECVKFRDSGAVPGTCKKVVGLRTCSPEGLAPLGGHMTISVCPIFEDELAGASR